MAHEVTNVGLDRNQLANMALQAKDVIGSDQLDVVTDRGYFRGEEIKTCDESGITAYLPKPQTSGNAAKGLYGKRDFIYVAETDSYRCPAGEQLTRRTKTMDGNLITYRYWTSNCGTCSLKSYCTIGKERRVSRWEHEAVLDAAEARLDKEPERMRARRCMVEHPFGTLKSWMGHAHFLMKTKQHVSTEMSLHVLAYNMKRVMNMMGTRFLFKAIQA